MNCDELVDEMLSCSGGTAEKQPGLNSDLEGEPFVRHALSSATCELYYRSGMFLAPLKAPLTTMKHCQFGHRCPVIINDEIKQTAEGLQAVPVERPAVTASPTEPTHVKRLTEKKANDPKKMATGRAGAARQKRLLEQHQADKESLRPPVSSADNDVTSASPNEAKLPKRTDEWPEHNHNWIPWIIRACLAWGLLVYVFAGEKMRLRASCASIAADPAPKVRDKPSQLKACHDPHYMQ